MISNKGYAFISLLFISSTISLSCTVNKKFLVIDGNRAAGTVTMAYEYGLYEKPIVDWSETKRVASERCKDWGYSSAKLFDSTIQECLGYNQHGNCVNWRIYLKAQCID
jgi:hypothetical protein